MCCPRIQFTLAEIFLSVVINVELYKAGREAYLEEQANRRIKRFVDENQFGINQSSFDNLEFYVRQLVKRSIDLYLHYSFEDQATSLTFSGLRRGSYATRTVYSTAKWNLALFSSGYTRRDLCCKTEERFYPAGANYCSAANDDLNRHLEGGGQQF